MIYNNVIERTKEIKKELSQDYRFYLYKLGEQVKEARLMFCLSAILTLIIIPFSIHLGGVLMIATTWIFIKFLYDANRFQNIYEREKIKKEDKKK